MTQPLQQSPYLRVQRNFPRDDPQALAVEIDKAYIDTASKLNDRIIGTVAINIPLVTGEQWFITGQPNKQQSLRQLYSFSATGSIPHGINFATVALISPRTYGSFTDGTNWYGAIFASNVAIAGQISFYVTPTNIVVIAGAAPPTIISGFIILEWVSQF